MDLNCIVQELALNSPVTKLVLNNRHGAIELTLAPPQKSQILYFTNSTAPLGRTSTSAMARYQCAYFKYSFIIT